MLDKHLLSNMFPLVIGKLQHHTLAAVCERAWFTMSMRFSKQDRCCSTSAEMRDSLKGYFIDLKGHQKSVFIKPFRF